MAQRRTRKAGIPQSRHPDPNIQRTFDALIERLEVLDGLRGDALDQAITYRDLEASGFTIGSGVGGGAPSVTPPPDDGTGGDGPVIGPTTAPTNLVVSETFLALLCTWSNPSFNLQHIQVWRSLTDNLSTAQLIGTTVAPLYVDYVGELKTFYYWVRAVATDGTFSPYNAVAGTVGTTGLDPSSFEFNLNISGSNLDAVLAARIDLIDIDGVLLPSLMNRVATATDDILAIDARTLILEVDTGLVATTVGDHTVLIDGQATLISDQTTVISALSDVVDGLDIDLGLLDARVVINASDILNLEANLGALDAEGGQTWEFLTDVDGFTAVNASIASFAGYISFEPTAADPQLISETIAISGGIYTQVVARVRQTIGGGTWEGNCYYETGGHTMTSSHVKTIPNPNLALSEWTTLTWDMANLTTGGADWENSVITKIRLDLVWDNAGVRDRLDHHSQVQHHGHVRRT